MYLCLFTPTEDPKLQFKQEAKPGVFNKSKQLNLMLRSSGDCSGANWEES